MILDLHIHSRHSFDSISKPNDIIKVAKRKGLNGIAITDHNTIKGGVEAKEINRDRDFLVIVGAEITTEMGDIMGLFLSEEIKSRNSIEVVREIQRQGGIAVLPHPYKGHRLNEEVLKTIDVIEGFNSRTSERDNRKAIKLAKRYRKPIVAGSDAHFCSEIGASTVVLNSMDIKHEILKGRIELKTKYTPVYMQSVSQMIKSVKLRRHGKIPLQFIRFIVNLLRRR